MRLVDGLSGNQCLENAIACKFTSKRPTDPSDCRSAPKHIKVSNHEFL